MNFQKDSLMIRMRSLTAFFLGGILVTMTLSAQEASRQVPSVPIPSTPEARESTSFLRRFSGGGRLGGQVFDLLREDKTTVKSTAVEYDYTMNSRSPHVGGGGTLEIRVTKKLWFSADLLIYRFGYLTSTDILTGVLPATGADTRKKVTTTEKTRATFWDTPLLGHYNILQTKGKGGKIFATGGVNLRRVTGIHTAWETNDTNAKVCCTSDPAKPAHSWAKGWVGGFGVRLIDDFGIKMTPEARYTRWSDDTFSGVPAQSRKMQVEILLGFTF